MDEEIRRIVEAERRRNQEAAQRRRERLKRARREAPRIAGELARIEPDVDEVWLFGSVGTGRVGRDEFDIDLAVTGADVVSLYARLPDSEFEVDLVDLESVSDLFREMIYRRGWRIYGTDT
jgi:predicted nucleotidyltransferase